MDLLKMPGVVYCEFEKGATIIRQGEKVDFVYYLRSGTCYRKTLTEKGDEIIYGVKESDQNFVQSVLGALILYSDGISISNFFARSKCCCLKIPKDVFFQYVQDKPEILTQLLYMSMKELRRLSTTFQARQEGRVANQLCRHLLNSAKQSQNKLLVVKGYSNLEFSQFLGVHKVTIARILRVLKNEKIIAREKEGIVILDEQRLTDYAKAEKVIDY